MTYSDELKWYTTTKNLLRPVENTELALQVWPQWSSTFVKKVTWNDQNSHPTESDPYMSLEKFCPLDMMLVVKNEAKTNNRNRGQSKQIGSDMLQNLSCGQLGSLQLNLWICEVSSNFKARVTNASQWDSNASMCSFTALSALSFVW